ncbi:MAG: hypothetical protein JST35_01620 [Armatimonadetes bacterium]|nr:hypothetical protein [Armatimonadota bacterium]
MIKKSSPRLQRGFSMGLVLLFVLCFSIMGMALLGVTSTYDRTSKGAADKLQASSLAESGINALYDRIRLQMLETQSYPFTLPQTTAFYDNGKTKTVIGSYSAKITNVSKIDTDIDVGGGQMIRRSAYIFTIEGTGTATNGTVSNLSAQFSGNIDQSLIQQTQVVGGSPPPGEFTFPIGAIVSNERVDINTDMGLRTYSPNGLDAHIVGNSGITWQGKNSLKGSNYNPNVLDVQGQFLVPDGAIANLTKGKDGIGNSNGSKNYRNPAAPASGSFLGGLANSVLSMPTKVNFADKTTVNGWENDWSTRAGKPDAENHINIKSPSMPGRPGDGWKVVTAPATIQGNIEVASGDTLRFMPNSTNPKDNVVYVKGNLHNNGRVLNLGVTLVVKGKYTDAPGAEYKVDTQGSPFTTREMVMMRAALVILAEAPDAFTLTSSSAIDAGLIYTALGGMQIKGSNAEVTGLLVAGGSGNNGGINIDPDGGASFVVKYEPYAATGGPMPQDPNTKINTSWVPNGIAANFNPTKLQNWLQSK